MARASLPGRNNGGAQSRELLTSLKTSLLCTKPHHFANLLKPPQSLSIQALELGDSLHQTSVSKNNQVR
ncbi:hypothetical protein RB213_003720 [Colletotrichum asianum]